MISNFEHINSYIDGTLVLKSMNFIHNSTILIENAPHVTTDDEENFSHSIPRFNFHSSLCHRHLAALDQHREFLLS